VVLTTESCVRLVGVARHLLCYAMSNMSLSFFEARPRARGEVGWGLLPLDRKQG
jgi:hypothetical protein